MFITSIFILLFTIAYMLINFKKKLSYVIVFYLISISMMMLISTIYTTKTSIYRFPMKLDYKLYLLLSDIPIKLTLISRIYNLSFGLFMCSAIIGAREVLNLNYKKVLLLLLPILYFLLYNDPATTKNIHIALNISEPTEIVALKYFVTVSKTLNIIILTFYFIFPLIYVVLYFKQTKNILKRRYIISFGICIFLIELYVYLIFVNSVLKNIFFTNVNPAKLPISSTIVSAYIVAPIAFLICIIAIAAILIYNKPFGAFDIKIIRKRDISKNTKLLNKNLSMNLHIYKNAFWGAQQQFELIKKAINANDLNGLSEYADTGINIIRKQLTALEKTVEMLKYDNYVLEVIDIIECINEAILKIGVQSDVTYSKNFAEQSIIIMGNRDSLIEVFYNLFINSIESFDSNSNQKNCITINVASENQLCMIEIMDNGYGISKNNLRNIFKPFFSTKPRKKSSGIGLSYVESVIKSHHGEIAVVSEVGKYTSFQISLPIINRKDVV